MHMATPSERLQGTVDVLILKTLAWKPMHGYAIAQFLADKSQGELAVEGAALVPGPPSARAQRPHQVTLGHVRDQTARAHLRSHASGTRAARRRSRRLEALCGRRRPRARA